jgi:hypothetical protein
VKGGARPVKIVLADWAGYPLFRQRTLWTHRIECGSGRILENMERYQAGVPFDVILVINGKDPFNPASAYQALSKRHAFIEKVLFRDNTGFDIGAYNHGFQLLKNSQYQGDVLFMNSTLEGPSHDGWLLKYQKLFDQHEHTGLCGISMNSHNTNADRWVFMPHVQSFFLYTTMQVLQHVFADALCGAEVVDNRQTLIAEGEIGISQNILRAGYGIACLAFEDFFYTENGSWDVPEGDLRTKAEFREFANRI